MTPLEWLLFCCFLAAVVGGIASSESAYRNGVTDGYGYSREQNCPGYAKAGEYLRSAMSHRWPELRDDAEPDESDDRDDADLRW